MPRAKMLFTDKEVERLVKKAQAAGAPSVDIIPAGRDVIYRINLRQEAGDKKPVAYDWGIGNKEQDIVL